jgi:hypothetical protein
MEVLILNIRSNNPRRIPIVEERPRPLSYRCEAIAVAQFAKDESTILHDSSG